MNRDVVTLKFIFNPNLFVFNPNTSDSTLTCQSVAMLNQSNYLMMLFQS